MTKTLRVGVFGFYSYQNIGDNLMAYLFSRYLAEEGHKPIIYAKQRADRMDWGFPIVADLKQFAESVDVVVFGGGGLLIPRPKLAGAGLDFNKDIESLLNYTEEKAIPLLAFSIGGAGKDIDEIVPAARRRLIQRLNYVTLRNREDLKLLTQANTAGEFLDDVVWTTSQRIKGNAHEENRSRLRIGLNLYLGSSFRARLAKLAFQIVTRVRRDVDFVFYDIHPEEPDQFSAFSANLSQANCSRKILTDVEESCRETSSLDALITTRLHLGVIAMSYGVPCIAFAGAEKTRLLYNRISRSSFFWDLRETHKILQLFLFPGAINRLLRNARKPISPSILESAMQHYSRLSLALATILEESFRTAPNLNETS